MLAYFSKIVVILLDFISFLKNGGYKVEVRYDFFMDRLKKISMALIYILIT